MGFIQFLSIYWPWVLLALIILAGLIILLWRNYTIEELTPTPPFIKFKRRASPETPSQQASINISRNKMWGNNKIGVRRESVNVSDNKMMGDNDIEVGAKPGPKPKKRKKSR